MKKIYTRVVKYSFFDYAKRAFVLKYLDKLNLEYAQKRRARMAVYANDFIGMNIYVDGTYEINELDDLYEFLKFIRFDYSAGSAIDIGANIGNHTLNFAKNFEKVYSFEPNPFTFRLLKFNTELLGNVNIYEIGISDENKSITLSEDVSNYGGSSAVFDRLGGQKVDIDVKILDSFLTDFENIKLIKIDIEGMEYQALVGARQTIDKYRPVIVFEQHELEFGINGDESKAIKFLRDIDYEIFWVSRKYEKKNLVARRLANFIQIFLGKVDKRSVFTDNKIPKDTYPLLIAAHKSILPREAVQNSAATQAKGLRSVL